MGWFEDQINKRKKLDEKTFEDSFLSLAGDSAEKHLDEKALMENDAIARILAFYRLAYGDIPSSITAFEEKINYAFQPHEIQYHAVELNAAWLEENTAPLLAFTKAGHKPVVFLPRGDKGYYYVNYKTKKHVRVTPAVVEKVEPEAYSFYRSLPSHKTTVKEYARYLRKSIRPWDTIVFFLLSAIVVGVGFALPYLTKTLTGEVVSTGDMNQFIVIALYVVAAATGLLFLKSLQAFLNARIAIRREKAIEEATMMRLLSLPPSFFKQFNTGELTSRARSVPLLATTLINGVFMSAASAVMSFAYLFQLGSFTPSLILPVILVLVVTIGFTLAVAVVRRKHTQKVLELSSKESGVTYEMINGIQKIRLSGSEKRVFSKWVSAYSKNARVRYRPPLILRLAPAITLLITLLGNIAFYYIAATNNTSPADYMAFVTTYGFLSAALTSIGESAGLMSTVHPLFSLARPILNAEPEITQGKEVLENPRGDIRLENVSFQYGESGAKILDHLSLDIHEGEYIAIVGKTGCGKSTFVRLLLGFEKPTGGQIYYDTKPIDTLDLSALRRNIGTVMQNGTLFHADILSNIIISAPNLTEEDAWDAAKIADIADDIRAMPMKMKTVISEGQGGISGGQKQRIMIARAIVHKPKILIFDEATSALDNKTQKSISDSISKLNCTRIVIAHRLSTIQHADRILMLDGGKVVESGDYDSLIAKKGLFAELVERQRLDDPS